MDRDLEGKRLVLAEDYSPTAGDNAIAWAAIRPLLDAAATKGVYYEQLIATASAATKSPGRTFIRYLHRNRHLAIAGEQ